MAKGRLAADLLIDEVSELPINEQPRWFTELYKDWTAGVSTSERYLSPDGLPEEEETDALCPRCGMDELCLCPEFDEEEEDEFDDDEEDEFDDEEEGD
jgi:hypothetical protein